MAVLAEGVGEQQTSSNGDFQGISTTVTTKEVGSKVITVTGEDDESGVEDDFSIDRETTLFDIRDNLTEYLAQDLKSEKPLQSNLLTFVLKYYYETDVEKFDEVMSDPSVRVQLDSNPELEEKIEKRIESLEYAQIGNYIFLFPRDQWDENKTELTERNGEGRYLTPELTAILMDPVEFCYGDTFDGDSSEDKTRYVVYGEEWVGREVRHFPFSKELIAAEARAQKIFGKDYHIPKSLEAFYLAVRKQVLEEKAVDPIPLNYSQMKKLKEAISQKFISEYGFSLSGYVTDSELARTDVVGFYWQNQKERGTHIGRCLVVSMGDFPGVNCYYNQGFRVAQSVRLAFGDPDFDAEEDN